MNESSCDPHPRRELVPQPYSFQVQQNSSHGEQGLAGDPCKSVSSFSKVRLPQVTKEPNSLSFPNDASPRKLQPREHPTGLQARSCFSKDEIIDEPIVWSIKTLLREKKKRAKREEQDSIMRASDNTVGLCSSSQAHNQLAVSLAGASTSGAVVLSSHGRAGVASGTPKHRNHRLVTDDLTHNANSRNDLITSFQGHDTSKSSHYVSSKDYEKANGVMTPGMYAPKGPPQPNPNVGAILEKVEGNYVKKKKSLNKKERAEKAAAAASGPGVMLPSTVTTLSGASAIDNFDRIMHRVEEKLRDRERKMERGNTKKMPHLVCLVSSHCWQVLRDQKEVVYKERAGGRDKGNGGNPSS